MKNATQQMTKMVRQLSTPLLKARLGQLQGELTGVEAWSKAIIECELSKRGE